MNIERNKGARRPIIDPLLLVLRSRRVLIALAALLVGMLVMWIPVLGAVQGELLTLVTALALALIGGLSLEDAAYAVRGAAPPPPELDNRVHDAVNEVLAVLLAERDED
jgi:hypothetical protein